MYIVLYNPLSKNNKSIKIVNKLIGYMEKKNYQYRAKSILHVDDIKTFIDSLNKNDKIILVGGDGTFSQFLYSIDRYDIKQEIFFYPAGTGNDFIRTLYLNKKIKKFESIFFERKVKIDFPHAKGEHINRNFINGCGFGFDAEVTRKANQSKVKNTGSYLVNIITTIFSYKRANAKVTIDKKTYNFKKIWTIVVQNGKFFGGGMKIAPKAEINDKLLDVCIVHKMSLPLLLLLLPTVFLGWHIKLKKFGIFYTQAKNIEIEFDKSLIGQMDGDILEPEKHIYIKI